MIVLQKKLLKKKILYFSFSAIFQNRNTGRKLVYYPVAKNANSSAKLFFLKHFKKLKPEF